MHWITDLNTNTIRCGNNRMEYNSKFGLLWDDWCLDWMLLRLGVLQLKRNCKPPTRYIMPCWLNCEGRGEKIASDSHPISEVTRWGEGTSRVSTQRLAGEIDWDSNLCKERRKSVMNSFIIFGQRTEESYGKQFFIFTILQRIKSYAMFLQLSGILTSQLRSD